MTCSPAGCASHQMLPDRGEAIAPRVAAIAGQVLGWDAARQAAERRDATWTGAHREFDVPGRPRLPRARGRRKPRRKWVSPRLRFARRLRPARPAAHAHSRSHVRHSVSSGTHQHTRGPGQEAATTGGDRHVADKTLTCSDCGMEFAFTEREQAFYAEKGFSEPRRCPSCRASRKAARSGGDSGGTAAARTRAAAAMTPGTAAAAAIPPAVVQQRRRRWLRPAQQRPARDVRGDVLELRQGSQRALPADQRQARLLLGLLPHPARRLSSSATPHAGSRSPRPGFRSARARAPAAPRCTIDPMPPPARALRPAAPVRRPARDPSGDPLTVAVGSSNDFDLVVLGAGTGGYAAAFRAAQLGSRSPSWTRTSSAAPASTAAASRRRRCSRARRSTSASTTRRLRAHLAGEPPDHAKIAARRDMIVNRMWKGVDSSSRSTTSPGSPAAAGSTGPTRSASSSPARTVPRARAGSGSSTRRTWSWPRARASSASRGSSRTARAS